MNELLLQLLDATPPPPADAGEAMVVALETMVAAREPLLRELGQRISARVPFDAEGKALLARLQDLNVQWAAAIDEARHTAKAQRQAARRYR